MGAVSVFLIPILIAASVGYLGLYYRNVSFAVTDGQLVRTGPLGLKRSVPTEAIRRLIRLNTVSNASGVVQVLVLGDDDRCLMIIGRSNEYAASDLDNLAKATGATLTDLGALSLAQFARQYPSAASGFGSFVIRVWSRLRLIQVMVVLLIILAVVV